MSRISNLQNLALEKDACGCGMVELENMADTENAGMKLADTLRSFGYNVIYAFDSVNYRLVVTDSGGRIRIDSRDIVDCHQDVIDMARLVEHHNINASLIAMQPRMAKMGMKLRDCHNPDIKSDETAFQDDRNPDLERLRKALYAAISSHSTEKQISVELLNGGLLGDTPFPLTSAGILQLECELSRYEVEWLLGDIMSEIYCLDWNIHRRSDGAYRIVGHKNRDLITYDILPGDVEKAKEVVEKVRTAAMRHREYGAAQHSESSDTGAKS